MTPEEQVKTLQKYLRALDQMLTGNSEQEALRMSNQVESLEKYLGGSQYYLSDGGYSRVYISLLEDVVFVTSNSLERVKSAWETPAVQNLIKGLMVFMRYIQEEFLRED